ncbi:lipase family protein [Thermomonospora umbrina]|uniref:Secretory lipase n=1 Tax=Thermomonospora umbrina TaxID=111806 RepID=A0A3D9SS62_9ACTN|nr:lipase family protein [Thermomonospora umbrina]REE95464.1 secretory lipase [Thermomonospora umbrina]
MGDATPPHATAITTNPTNDATAPHATTVAVAASPRMSGATTPRATTVAVVAAFALVGGGTVAHAAAAPQSAGTVLSATPLPPALWIPGTGRAYRVTYLSPGPSGRLLPTTGAIFIPKGAREDRPVVSWAHGTVGLGDSCAPSSAGRSQRDLTYLAHWMSQGYAVVSTDYSGLGGPGVHPYLDGRTAGRNVTDMVRAARRVDRSLSRRWVAIGQSQGGHAALVTASLATRYAPDLDFRGAVATGAPSNLAAVFSLAGPYLPRIPFAATYTTYLLAGLKAARPGFDVDRYLTAEGRAAVRDAETLCYADQTRRMAGLSIADLLSRTLLDPAFRSTAKDVTDVPVKGYDRPLFIAQGTRDTDVPLPLSWKLVGDLTAHGVRHVYRVYPGSDHSATMAASLPDTTPFVARLFR